MDRQPLLGHLTRTVRVVVWTTQGVVVALIVSFLLPGGAPLRAGPLLIILAVAALLVGAAFLPWSSLFGSATGLAFFYGWTVSYIAIISVGIDLTGGGSSPLFFLYALPIVFAALAYRPLAQVMFLALTYAAYLTALAATGWAVTPARLFVQLVFLGTLALLTSFLALELNRQMSEVRAARTESERRAGLMAVVTHTAHSASSLRSERVLEEVVRGAIRLGFEAANLIAYDTSGLHYRVVFGIGLPLAYTEVPHPMEAGLPGLVRERRATVVVEDYGAHPRAIPLLREAGFQTVIASPVWIQGGLDAVLLAGTKQPRVITGEDVEAFELLAALAGRALENARMFEDEHRAVERLGELDQLKTDFLSTVSHELRTPLTAIEGVGQTLEQQWEELDDEVRDDLLRRLNANAGSLHRIITTLLDFSRLEAGRMDIRLEPVPVREFAEGLVVRLRETLAAHPVSVAVPTDLLVRADPGLLERVLENLLTNAAMYTPDGTAVEITAHLESDGHAMVAVVDRGPGIPEQELPHLGERFFRGGDVNARVTGGAGLGLAIVREVLRLHGSELRVDSEVGRGSRFFFRLRTAEHPSPTVAPGERTSS
jgi:signal transduction histidine kinase